MIIIAGPNGSGKTSVTQKFLHHEWAEGTLYINPDEVARDKFGDWNSAEAVRKAADYCASLREECLREHLALKHREHRPSRILGPAVLVLFVYPSGS